MRRHVTAALVLISVWLIFGMPSGFRVQTTQAQPPKDEADVGYQVQVAQLADEFAARLEGSHAVEGTLGEQRIEAAQVESRLANARMARQLAEIAVKEYDDGLYPQAVQDAEGQIEEAEGDVARAKERLKILDIALAKEAGQPLLQRARVDDEASLRRAERALVVARKEREILERFTRPSKHAQFSAEVDRARSDELKAKASLTLEKEKERRLRDQVERDRPTEEERRAMVAFEEALDLDRKGEKDLAGVKLDEARRRWLGARTDRSVARYNVLKKTGR